MPTPAMNLSFKIKKATFAKNDQGKVKTKDTTVYRRRGVTSNLTENLESISLSNATPKKLKEDLALNLSSQPLAAPKNFVEMQKNAAENLETERDVLVPNHIEHATKPTFEAVT
jgi:hypothetical protein